MSSKSSYDFRTRSEKLTEAKKSLLSELDNLTGSGHAFILFDTPITCAKVARLLKQNPDLFRHTNKINPSLDVTRSDPQDQLQPRQIKEEYDPMVAFPTRFKGADITMYK